MPDLGAYAFEVLTAYGVTFVVLLVLIGASWRRSVRAKAALERVENDG